MKNHRSDEVKKICTSHIHNGCHEVCPLAGACKPHAFDDQEVYDARMNRAAEKLIANEN